MNNKYVSRVGLCVGLTLIAAGAVAQEGDVERGQAAAASCSACHQADGSGMNLSLIHI